MKRRDDPFRVPQHRAGYEPFEKRLVLSAQALAAFAEPAAAPSTQPVQYGALVPTEDPSRELTEDLAYVKQRYGLTGQNQTVAVIDSGIAYDHLALGGGFGDGHRVVGGWDFTEENDADPFDDGPAGFHGTHVAGVIGSDNETHPGVATGVDFVALRVFNDQGVGRFEWLEKALQWVHENRDAFEHPITTVNLSLGTNLQPGETEPRILLEDEFAQLKSDGIFVAVAAGNSYENEQVDGLSYPASSQFVVPVASMDGDDSLSDFSQRDPRVLAAPGERVTSTVPSHLFGGGGVPNDFAYAHGTSMATPYVAGAGVLVREAMQQVGYVDITQDTIEQHLRATADTVIDAASQESYARLNLRNAIDSLLDAPSAQAGVVIDGPLIRITGTSADDRLEVTVGDSSLFTFNGVPFPIDANITEIAFAGEAGHNTLHLMAGGGDDQIHVSTDRIALANRFEISLLQIAEVEINGGQGYDSIEMLDTIDDDTVTARPLAISLRSEQFSAMASGFERVKISSVTGGNDVAQLFDSPANDRFYGYSNYAMMSGIGYQNEVHGFGQVYGHSESGGADQVHFHDSTANDRFYAQQQYVRMTGMSYQNQATGFGEIFAYATIGGDDQAFLYDTPGNERFSGYASHAVLSGTGRQITVRGFDRVEAHAVAGGQDTATFHDSVGDDRFRGYPTYATMSGDGYQHLVRGFSTVSADSVYGRDTARLQGSFRDESLQVTRHDAILTGAMFRMTIHQFDHVEVDGDGGADTAAFYDLGAGDNFTGLGNRAAASYRDAATRVASNFDLVTLHSDDIEAEIGALDFVCGSNTLRPPQALPANEARISKAHVARRIGLCRLLRCLFRIHRHRGLVSGNRSRFLSRFRRTFVNGYRRVEHTRQSLSRPAC